MQRIVQTISHRLNHTSLSYKAILDYSWCISPTYIRLVERYKWKSIIISRAFLNNAWNQKGKPSQPPHTNGVYLHDLSNVWKNFTETWLMHDPTWVFSHYHTINWNRKEIINSLSQWLISYWHICIYKLWTLLFNLSCQTGPLKWRTNVVITWKD